jgi:hypothetical protein
MAVHRLTDRWLASFQPPPRGRLEFADGLCPGLRARITSKGKKSFSVVHWVNGRQQRVTLGLYPLLSLADARTRAKEVLLGQSEPSDPPAEKAHSDPQLSYRGLADEYLERYLKPNTRSWRNVHSSLVKLSCPLLSGPSTVLFWTMKEKLNAIEEAQAGGDHRQVA